MPLDGARGHPTVEGDVQVRVGHRHLEGHPALEPRGQRLQQRPVDAVQLDGFRAVDPFSTATDQALRTSSYCSGITPSTEANRILTELNAMSLCCLSKRLNAGA